MISVVVPAYNAEGTIGKCIEALLRQDCREQYEIIVVDDGSSDRTKNIVRQFRDAGRIKLVEQQHGGPAKARNAGAREAKGDIILFTDSDCIPEKNWVTEMAKPFSNPSVAGVQGRYRTMQQSIVARFAQTEIEERYRRVMKMGIDGIGTYSAAYRKGIFSEMGGFDENFPMASGEDFDLSFRMKDGLVFNPEAVVYHQHPETLGDYASQKFWRACWRVLLYKKHPGKIAAESHTPQILKLQIVLFYVFILLLILSLFFSGFAIYSVSALILLAISTIPFSKNIFRYDKRVALMSPFFLVLRAAVFGAGLLYGLVRR